MSVAFGVRLHSGGFEGDDDPPVVLKPKPMNARFTPGYMILTKVIVGGEDHQCAIGDIYILPVRCGCPPMQVDLRQSQGR